MKPIIVAKNRASQLDRYSMLFYLLLMIEKYKYTDIVALIPTPSPNNHETKSNILFYLLNFYRTPKGQLTAIFYMFPFFFTKI